MADSKVAQRLCFGFSYEALKEIILMLAEKDEDLQARIKDCGSNFRVVGVEDCFLKGRMKINVIAPPDAGIISEGQDARTVLTLTSDDIRVMKDRENKL